MTNYEHIKSLTLKEMAEFFDKIINQDREDWSPLGCFHCDSYGTHHYNKLECGKCEYYGGLKQWLEREKY